MKTITQLRGNTLIPLENLLGEFNGKILPKEMNLETLTMETIF